MLDEIPALAVAAAFADGVTEIRDAAELAVKESNRIGAIQQELVRARASRVEARADGLAIRGGVARTGRRSRATATTASRWRPRSPRNAIEGSVDGPGLAGVVVVVSRVRRRSRPRSTGAP